MTPSAPSISDLAMAFESAQSQLENDTAAQTKTADNLTKAQAADEAAKTAIVQDKGTVFQNGQTLIAAIQAAISPFAPGAPTP